MQRFTFQRHYALTLLKNRWVKVLENGSKRPGFNETPNNTPDIAALNTTAAAGSSL